MANMMSGKICITKTKNDERDLSDLAFEIVESITDLIGDSTNEDIDEDYIEVDIDFRWVIPTEELREIAQKWEVNIHSRGEEAGNGFYQVVNIDRKGEVIKDETLDFFN